MNTTPTPDQTPERHDCGNTIRITQYPIYKDGTHEVVSCGCGQVISDALYETDPHVRAKKRQEKIDQMESELTALRATNATLLQRIAKLEENRADLSKGVQWLIDNTSEETKRLFPITIASLQKIASAVLPPTPGKEGE